MIKSTYLYARSVPSFIPNYISHNREKERAIETLTLTPSLKTEALPSPSLPTIAVCSFRPPSTFVTSIVRHRQWTEHKGDLGEFAWPRGLPQPSTIALCLLLFLYLFLSAFAIWCNFLLVMQISRLCCPPLAVRGPPSVHY